MALFAKFAAPPPDSCSGLGAVLAKLPQRQSFPKPRLGHWETKPASRWEWQASGLSLHGLKSQSFAYYQESLLMPYFIYQKTEKPLTLSHISTQEGYRKAKELVRSLRQDHPLSGDAAYRMIFAKSMGEAERLLSTPRDERVIGED